MLLTSPEVAMPNLAYTSFSYNPVASVILPALNRLNILTITTFVYTFNVEKHRVQPGLSTVVLVLLFVNLLHCFLLCQMTVNIMLAQ
ncbi:hypothetical protein BJY00DRAFT_294625 [Aspergillus carlsbadensis]|nr:hypothetical protein BJY00DRAFT_294625 [Aspergillus carlsbadensis]